LGWTPDTDPSECYQWSAFGSGPFPPPGADLAVYDCPSYPHGSGYGGVGWSIGGGDGDGPIGSPYGMSSFGSRFFPAPDVPVDGGYGGDAFGTGPYGSTEHIAPRMTSALSLNGWEIEVFFSEPMDDNNPALLDPASYTLTAIVGGPSVVSQVVRGDMGSIGVSVGDYLGGVMSVILTHSGTMLGGTYRINCVGPTDTAGNPILNVPITIYTKGEAPPYVVYPISGDELIFSFFHAMLPTVEEPPGNLYGIQDVESYGFTASPDFPIAITPVTVTHPYEGDTHMVHMQVNGMTSLDYLANISPATAFDYDGTVLPSDDPAFDGIEIFPANGTSQADAGYLWMSKVANEPYGWGFWDTSGKASLDPATFRVDFTINAESAQYVPPLASFPNPHVGILRVQSGPPGAGVQVDITFQKSLGVDQLHVQSGTFDVILDVPWSVGTNTISVVRNRKGGIYSILFNELPITSAAEALLDQPSMGDGGVSWYFYDEAYSISGFTIRALIYTATKTVFSAAWNFLHNASYPFVGSPALARDSILTRRGPLVKGWGDATPATKQDVGVKVNGVPVEVALVNPYIGEITTTIPIPLMPPGDPQADVKLDYQWMNTPVMVMAGLNTPGLVLNKWNRTRGHHDPPAHGEQIQTLPAFPKGAPDTARFPMGIVLGPMARPQPQLIGHRYMGFEREYSALLNSPTTLLLNQSPHAGQQEGFEKPLEGYAVSYEGTVVPTASSPVWELLGTDSGQVNVNEGTYTVTDLSSGPFNPDDPQVVEYYRLGDLTFPSSVSMVTRFYVEEENLSPDGVFTGVGFGFHDDNHLYLIGALLVNGLQHVGMLRDARYIQNVESWEIGPKTTGTIEDSTTMRVISAEVPLDLKDGDQFQILEGTQAGVYTAEHVVAQCDGTTTLTVSPAFPADPKLFGNTYPEVIFEVEWGSKASSYRLTVNPDAPVVQLEVSGVTTATVLTYTGSACALEEPANTGLSLIIGQGGEFFWGSLSRRGTSQSKWSFTRYAVVPDQTTIRGFATRVLTEMGTVPQCAEDEWFITQPFGYSKVDSSGNTLLLKSTSASESLDFSFGYERLEPVFVPDTNFDLRVKFKVESGTLGAGDAEAVLNDGVREVRLATLLYVNDLPGAEIRKLINLPVTNISGILDPTSQGWEVISGSDGIRAVHAQDLVVTQAMGQAIRFRSYLDKTGLLFSDEGGRILEARLAVDSWTGDVDGNTGIRFHADVGGDHHLGVRLRGGPNSAVQIIDINDDVVQEYSFDWDDGEFHTYRVVAPLSAVTLYIDDTAQSPSRNITDFPGNTGQDQVVFGASTQIAGVPQDLASETRWRSLSYSLRPTDQCRRTVGVWKGGDKDHINSWEIPRTDSTTAPNSSYLAVIEEMDWRDFMELRILRTPDWGVTVFRPDLPLPPYYKPETPGVVGTGFATYTTEPSAGWINVEYPDLPRVSSAFGKCEWGSLDPRAVTQQRWEYVRYKLFKPITNDYTAPQHMVFNYYNVITSGERSLDVTYENVVVTTIDSRRVTLKPTHLFADSIWKVVDGDTIYTYENFTLSPDNQTITLGQDSLGNDYHFSGDHVPVNIIFIPGKPVTNTYLEAQPLLDSVTLLNEGTPPVPKSQQGRDYWEIVGVSSSIGASVGSSVGGSGGPLGYDILSFTNDPDTLYEELDFFEVKQGETGLLSTICEGGLPQGESGYSSEGGDPIYSPDGTGPALGGTGASAGLYETGQTTGSPSGAFVLTLGGSSFWERVDPPHQELLPSLGGTELPSNFLIASGGDYLGPVVDGTGKVIGQKPLGGMVGETVLYPNAPPGSYH